MHRRLQYPSNTVCFRPQPNIITGITTTMFTNYNYSYSVAQSTLFCICPVFVYIYLIYIVSIASSYFPLFVLYLYLTIFHYIFCFVISLHLFRHYFYCPFTLLFIFIYVLTNSGPNVFDFIRSYSLYSNLRECSCEHFSSHLFLQFPVSSHRSIIRKTCPLFILL